MPTPIIFDTDPGHDDAIALLLAAKSPEIDIRAVTCVAGNQTLEKCALNARRVMSIGNITGIPVAAGMDRPLTRALRTAPQAHGETGLDGYDFPSPTIDLVPEHGVDLIIRTVRESKEPITLVPIGPMTNIAMAFRLAPDIKANVSRIVMMGGAAGRGNVTPSAEFNIYVDPEAAAVLFESGLPITMVGLDATHQARITAADIQRIRDLGSPPAVMIASLLDWYRAGSERRMRWDGAPIHDALALASIIRPDLIETQHMNVVVETEGRYTEGRTVCDTVGSSGRAPNADVALGVKRQEFIELLIERLARY
ncbi:MAG: nucleoside hydrolase [Chloroflexota bacterium]